MKFISIISFFVILMLFNHSVLSQEQETVYSLRDNTALDDLSNEPVIKKWQEDIQPLARAYVQQPPLIPHSIDKYKINLNNNQCLNCHSWANYQKNQATKISQTHFKNRDGIELADISASRYFCPQCHVPQVEAQPLVENTFKSVRSIQTR